MSPIKKVAVWTSSLAVLAVVFASAPAVAETTAEIDSGVQATLEKFYAAKPSYRELVDKAAAVLVFPSVTKGGAGIGGEHGEGVNRGPRRDAAG